MSAIFSEFKFWYAKSLTENSFAQADDDYKIQNNSANRLLYCIPTEFTKRMVDTSNALAVDKTEPDTGTAIPAIELRFAHDRSLAATPAILNNLIKLFYQRGNDSDFPKGRFGLTTTDNPGLNLTPVATAGYKLLSIRQEPNPTYPTIQIFSIFLHLTGDHEQLGAFS